MTACTKTDRPLISVLLATYNPNLDWFNDLLVSLNSQTYGNFEVIVLDDCSTEIDFASLQEFVTSRLNLVSCKIYKNEKNVGSNQTFENLVGYASGEYVAFCDQDDIWHNDKLSTAYTALVNSNKPLVCSDVRVIDNTGALVADSITKIRKRHDFAPKNLVEYLTYKNFVIGCTTLAETDAVKKSLPFAKNMVHDHYLALYFAQNGGIEVIDEPTIDYRIHGNNQTGVMCKVNNRDDYLVYRIELFERRIDELITRFSYEELDRAKLWSNARKSNFNKEKGSFRALWKLRRINRSTTYFELFALRCGLLFKLALKLIKKGIL